MKKILILGLLSFSLVLAACGQQNNTTSTDLTAGYTDAQKASLAACLTEKGIIMYGTEWCPHCKNQKAAFGTAFAGVTYIDCDKQKIQCTTAGITWFPTWIAPSGQVLMGEQSLDQLAAVGWCSL